MAVNALRDDLFSLIEAFASPRQGAGDNVALTAQAEQAKQTPNPPPPPTDPNQPLPFTPPTPVATRKIDPLTGGGGTTALAGGAGTDTLGGGGGTDTLQPPPPPDPTTPPVLAGATPPADGGTGNIMDMVKQQMAAQQKQQAANQRMGGLQQLVSGGQLALAGMTSSPSMRGVLANAASQSAQAAGNAGNAGTGTGGAGAGGMPSMSEMLALQKHGEDLASQQAMRKRLPGLAKSLQVPLEVLEAMNDKDLSELMKADASRDRKVEKNSDGTFTVVDPRRPDDAPKIIGTVDPYLKKDQEIQEQTAAEASAEAQRKAQAFPGEQARAQADADQKAAEAERKAKAFPDEQNRLAAEEARKKAEALRAEQLHPGALKEKELANEKAAGDVLKLADEVTKQKDFNAVVADPVQRKAIADRLGVTPDEVNRLHLTGELKAVMGDLAKGGADYKDWLNAGKPGSYADYLKNALDKRKSVASPEDAEKLKTNTDVGKAQDTARTSVESMPTVLAAKRIMDTDQFYTGPVTGNAKVQKLTQIVKDLRLPIEVPEGITDIQVWKAQVKAQLKGQVGRETTNADMAILEQILGTDSELNQDTIKQLGEIAVRRNLTQQLGYRREMERAMVNSRDPADKAHYQERIKHFDSEMNDYVGDAFKPKFVNALVRDVQEAKTDAERTKWKKKFDAINGAGTADYILRTRGIP